MKAASSTQPRFVWQGLLIVLPACLLAGVGFFSLRQDRLLAYHQASEQARQLVRDFVDTQLPAAFKLELPDPATIAEVAGRFMEPSQDQVWKLHSSSDPAALWLAGPDGELVYPPPREGYPKPMPLRLDELTSAQLELWNQASRGVVREAPELLQSLMALEQFLETSSPARFAALAQFALGSALLELGKPAEAMSHFETVASRHSSVIGETGLPLKLLANLRLLSIELSRHGASLLPRIHSIASTCIRHPSSVTAEILAELPRPDGMAALGLSTNSLRTAWTASEQSAFSAWQQVWAAHENARRLHREFAIENSWIAVSPGDAPFTAEDGTQYFQQAISGGGFTWHVARSLPAIQARALELARSLPLPPYLALDLKNSSGIVLPVRGDPEVLGEAISGPILGLTWSARIHLANPALLYARQRTRTVWFGLLIATSAAAVLAGFLAARQAFRRQQRLAELKSNFVSSVSHELRAPIASVRLMAEELVDLGPEERPKQREYHRFIVQECRRLSTLIENVLDFSRHEQGRKQYEFEPTNLLALADQTTRLMQSFAQQRGIELDFTVAGEPVEAEIDADAIQQVLVNLLDNAIKHSPENSRVAVGLSFPPGNEGPPAASALLKLTGHAKPSPNTVTLWVEDQGEGIPVEDQERIFERFYRRGSELRRQTQGVGLGLAIVKYVTEAHGGSIVVRSSPGHGSRFTVLLPLNKTQPNARSERYP